MERRRFESAERIEFRVARAAFAPPSEPLAGSRVALDALADMHLLAECDLFVLVLRSCFGRVAYALSAARKGRFAPLVSLEQPWSPQAGGRAKRGGGKRGRAKALVTAA